MTLLEKSATGEVDAFNRPIFEETPVQVDNVLIAPAGTGGTEIVAPLDLDGRKAVYLLAIPKEDTHDWEGQRVRFWGREWDVIGIPTRGIDALIPGPWNTIVQVDVVHGKASDRKT